MKRLYSALVAATLMTVLAVGTAAAVPAFLHATGGIGLSGPSQYVSFSAFDYGGTGDRGTVTYTNFEAPVSGSGVWNVGGTYSLTTALAGSPYVHTMTVDTVTPISTTATRFSGTGYYVADSSYTWTVTGVVSGSNISFDILYTGTAIGYIFHAVGTIAADGSMSGTATDSLGNAPLTWSTPAGSVHEVLSYTAAMSSVVVSGSTASFVYTIPAGNPYSGTVVTMSMTDGGSPGAGHDTFTIFGTPYTIVSGNLVVH